MAMDPDRDVLWELLRSLKGGRGGPWDTDTIHALANEDIHGHHTRDGIPRDRGLLRQDESLSQYPYLIPAYPMYSPPASYDYPSEEMREERDEDWYHYPDAEDIKNMQVTTTYGGTHLHLHSPSFLQECSPQEFSVSHSSPHSRSSSTSSSSTEQATKCPYKAIEHSLDQLQKFEKLQSSNHPRSYGTRSKYVQKPKEKKKEKCTREKTWEIEFSIKRALFPVFSSFRSKKGEGKKGMLVILREAQGLRRE